MSFQVILVLAVLGYLGWQIRSRKALPAASQYRKRQDDATTVFDVVPGRPTVRASMAVPVGLSGIGLLFFPWNGMVVAGAAVLAFLVWYSFKDYRPASHRQPAQFKVTPDGVETAGQRYLRGDIHRLILKNGVDTDYVFAAADTNAAVQQAAQFNDRIRAARMAYSLNVEEGGRSHELAAGLDETTASGLLHDVSRVLGFEG